MPNLNETYLFENESYQIIGACMNVHNELGPGFLESVYQEALALEFLESDVPFVKEQKLQVYYKEHVLNKFYVADFVCFEKVIVELKAINGLMKEHKAQVLNYLKATGYQLGLLINLGSGSLEYKRVIL